MIKIKVNPIPAFNDNYIWQLVHPENQCCVVVDPGDAQPVIHALEKQPYQLTAILITHHHHDHTGGMGELQHRYGAQTYGPAHDSVPGLAHQLSHGGRVNLDEIECTFDVIDTTGHTHGHIAYYGNGMLFCGDTLFTGGCGRVFEGTPQQMLESLNKLKALPDDTLVYCGHEYTLANLKFALACEPNNEDLLQRLVEVQKSRAANQPTVPAKLALEKKTNPFLRCDKPSVKQAAEERANRALSDTTQVFEVIREWKNQFKA